MKRLLVTGSRTWSDEQIIWRELIWAWHDLDGRDKPVTLISGACPSGADAIAERLWGRAGLLIERHPVEWKPYGIYNPQAGRYRNQVMVDLGADLCLAFIHRNSPGASHCAQAAEDAGIPVRIFRQVI